MAYQCPLWIPSTLLLLLRSMGFFYPIRFNYFLGNKFQLKEKERQSANSVWFIPFAVLFSGFFTSWIYYALAGLNGNIAWN